MRYGVILGVALAALAAAPAQAADQVVTGLDELRWDKDTVNVAPGDTVTWTFANTQQVHNVKSNGDGAADPNWASFASPLGRPAPDAAYKFEREGTYNFLCEVHPTTMLGKVVVSSAPAPQPVATPVPPSLQPYSNDAATPVVPEAVTLDETAPRLAAVSAKRVARRTARVRFRVSEESVVSVRLKRRGRTVRSAELAGSGIRGVNIRAPRGRYVVLVRAVDLAGNRSRLRTVRVTVR